MKIELDLSSEEAEMLVFACVLRAKQKGLSLPEVCIAQEVGQQIARAAGAIFGWSEPDTMFKRKMYPLKHVSIKVYETNRNPKP